MLENTKVSVIIPVYNNADTLKELTERLVDTFATLNCLYEVIFIDDGSEDQSARVITEVTSANSNIKAILLSRNYGQHPAISAGFEHATGDLIILMDADLEDLPEHIPILVEKIQSSKSDIVYTVKSSPNRLISRRFTSAIYHFTFSKIINTKVPLNIGTFRIFNRKFHSALLSFKENNILYGPLMFFMGFSSSYVDLPHSSTNRRRSSYTFIKRLKLAASSLISYTDIPHKLSLILGCLLFFSSMLYSILVGLQYFLFGTSLPDGLTLVLLVLFLMLGSLMIFLGIIGSYVFRVYQEVLNRPRYLVQDKLNMSD